MGVLSRQPWCVSSALLVPLLTLAAPAWLRIGGAPPVWAVLWLLPWALMEGRLSGALAGVGLGLLLDGLHGGATSLVPGLALLGWWWGRIGRKGPPIERSFGLGVLALLGTLLLDLSLMLQWVLLSWHGLREARIPVEGPAPVTAGMSLGDTGVDPAPRRCRAGTGMIWPERACTCCWPRPSSPRCWLRCSVPCSCCSGAS
jgi:hypothetical protein